MTIIPDPASTGTTGRYLRIGTWRDTEQYWNYSTGGFEAGVSVYALEPDGDPVVPRTANGPTPTSKAASPPTAPNTSSQAPPQGSARAANHR